MSTPEQPATPALTRKQLRDIRNTGATPIVNGDAAPADDQAPAEAGEERHDGEQSPDIVDSVPSVEEKKPEPEPEPENHAPIVAAPLPRAAVPVPVHDLPGADASVDLGVAPLTRRQARQQERIRTASVPVITPEVAAAHAASVAAAAARAGGEYAQPAEPETAHEAPADETPTEAPEEPTSGELSLAQLFGAEAEAAAEDAPVAEAIVESDTAEHAAAQPADAPHAEAPPAEAPIDAVPVAGVTETPTDEAESTQTDAQASAMRADDQEQTEADRAVVRPGFGAELLAGDTPQVELPPSFDQLITRSVTGSIGTGNALILSQTPSAPPLVAPVAATGEVLITGSYNLPEGLGSTGHANGTADGKETDAVLVDGELPAHSSPTPIAASAAISTVKNGGDLIKPPTPEKGGRLMLTLAITAGVLALALVGVLILAFVTGVF